MTTREQQFMQAAIEVAREGMNGGKGGPFGCVIVKGDEIVGKGCNSVLCNNDPTAHAEVMAIRDACKNLNSFQLTDCELYTSCEPCPMCLGAIYWARPKKVYFAANRYDAQDAGFDDSFIYKELVLPYQSRQIATTEFGREEAVKLFEEWGKLPGKVEY
ncbi:nucleoside deaminase [Pseudoflavitalea sp. G-6-1-2]|uniref:nucleoside deaminase n=1 Tax=Pseudoflavitalea sp. G-6-1-2 TaxID=2728841 RepID=UPI00146ABBA2|nr:nucleoside deaminase [Pseudoflavitalea sp. G-6-1-2]NML21095.1 nucleoside deaminase [Pseudoflavitalea sp. G-6-1-2]